MTLPDISKLPFPMVADIQRFREILARKFVLCLYQAHEYKTKYVVSA